MKRMLGESAYLNVWNFDYCSNLLHRTDSILLMCAISSSYCCYKYCAATFFYDSTGVEWQKKWKLWNGYFKTRPQLVAKSIGGFLTPSDDYIWWIKVNSSKVGHHLVPIMASKFYSVSCSCCWIENVEHTIGQAHRHIVIDACSKMEFRHSTLCNCYASE